MSVATEAGCPIALPTANDQATPINSTEASRVEGVFASTVERAMRSDLEKGAQDVTVFMALFMGIWLIG